MIPKNDHKLSATDEKIADKLTLMIVEELEKNAIARIHRYNTAFREDICRVVGKEFKKNDYYVALDFVPNGFRSLIVSKTPIPCPTGRLVSIEFL